MIRVITPFAFLAAFLLAGEALRRYRLPVETETWGGLDISYRPKGSFSDDWFTAELECQTSTGPCAVDMTYLYEVRIPDCPTREVAPWTEQCIVPTIGKVRVGNVEIWFGTYEPPIPLIERKDGQ